MDIVKYYKDIEVLNTFSALMNVIEGSNYVT